MKAPERRWTRGFERAGRWCGSRPRADTGNGSGNRESHNPDGESLPAGILSAYDPFAGRTVAQRVGFAPRFCGPAALLPQVVLATIRAGISFAFCEPFC